MPWRLFVLSLRAPLVHQLLVLYSNISSSEAESEEEIEVSPSKAPSSSKPVYYPRNVQNLVLRQVLENILKIWEEDYPWLHYMTQIVKVHSAKSAKHLGSHFIIRVESGQQSHSPTGKRLVTG